LIRVESAGIGQWDAFEREGLFVQVYGGQPQFPYVLGSEGAGTVVEVGARVGQFRKGDRVYALIGARVPKAGFYAQYAAVDAGEVWPVPGGMQTTEAGALPVDAGTALRGLRDILQLKMGQSVLVVGASGGIGHLAVHLGKQLGARVLAVASGADGVRFAERLGADVAVEGQNADVHTAARELARDGVDAALVTAGGEATDRALMVVRTGGRIAYPNGVQPAPRERPGVSVMAYNAMYDRELMDHLNRLIEDGPFEVHIQPAFPLTRTIDAHRALNAHHLGRLVVQPWLSEETQ
jgi:NADPH:quinone reductase-like Zn-dependent oxidoreductase